MEPAPSNYPMRAGNLCTPASAAEALEAAQRPAVFGSALRQCGFGDHLHTADAPHQTAGTRTQAAGADLTPKQAILELARKKHRDRQRAGAAPSLGGPWPVQSKEVTKSGARAFCTQPWPAFHRRYARMSEKQRVYHELIQHGEPCKLYFDIDAKDVREGDAGIRACHMRVQAFVGWVVAQLLLCWPALAEDVACLKRSLVDVTWLDASDGLTGRFSVHLVFNLIGNAMFADNGALARFVDWLVDRSAELERPLATLLPAEFVDEAERGMIDENVYTGSTDHELRIALSHKMSAPTRVLRYFDAARLAHYAPAATPAEAATRFYRSLVGYQPVAAHVRRTLACAYQTPYKHRLGGSGSSNSRGDIHMSRAGLAIRHSTNSLSAPSLSLPPLEEEEVKAAPVDATEVGEDAVSASDSHERTRAPKRPHEDEGGDKPDEDAAAAAGEEAALIREEMVALRLKDLLPRIEECISSDMPGLPALRFLYWSPVLGCITFASTNRMCEIKRDVHTSNHVFYVCWLETGIFYQRCFNAGCYELYCARRSKFTDDGTPGTKAAVALDTAEQRQGPADGINREGWVMSKARARGVSHMLDPSLWEETQALVLHPRHDVKRFRGGSGAVGRRGTIYDAGTLLGQDQLIRGAGEDDVDYLVREAMHELAGDLSDLFLD